MFSKEQISKMSEKEFQTNVLIPLFRAMKFRNVTAFGGGSLERGKDILMWKESDLGQRLNYGVVVKAIKITGNAETNSGAMNVLNQVRQMLKTNYLNPVNGQSEQIQRCFVACSQDITKEAMNSIEGELENHFNKLVEWIHPETNLYELIEKYLPEQNILEKLSSAQMELDELMKDTPYRLIVDSNGRISIFEKHENASKEMPFDIKTNFKFDVNTQEGKAAQQRFEDYYKKGTPAEIEGKFIESIEFPDFFPELLKPRLTENSKLILKPIPPDYIIPLRIETKLSNGEKVILDKVELQISQQGEEETTLTNQNQNVPFKIKFISNHKEETTQFHVNYSFVGYNVFQHLQALKFFNSLSKGGEMDFYSPETGLKLHSQKFEFKARANFVRDIELLETLVFIQEKTQTPITMPEKQPPSEHINHIFEVAKIIKNGMLRTKVFPIKAVVPLEKANEISKLFKGEEIKNVLIRSDDWNTNILDTEIDLGIGVIATDVFIAESDFKEIESQISANKSPIEFPLTPKEEFIVIDFLKWDCQDRHTRIRIAV